MTNQSRTFKSLKNSLYSLGFYIVSLGLQFFSRKIFLEQLGAEVLGLNTTALNLLQFINLAELGITSAVSFTLYKPIYEHNTKAINEIVTLQGYLYHRVALFVIAASGLLMFFFPWIFQKMALPLWYAYGSFGVLLFSSLLTYFVNYKQIVLSADQKGYKAIYSFKGVNLLKIFFQIATVYYTKDGYVWWLILEALFAALASVALHKTTIHEYPFLHSVDNSYKELKEKYGDFVIKIKQVFVHRIGGFALTQSSPLIIYAYANLTLVAIYGNYMLVISGILALVGSAFNSITAGIGNLIADGNLKQTISVFNELFSLRMAISGIMTFVTGYMISDMISLWIGNQYKLPNTTVILMLVIMFINLSRYSIESFINAYGLYHDIWAPLTESVLNIGFSILLGYYYGLNGVLCGVLISLVVIVLFWKPYFLFSQHFKGYLYTFVLSYIKHIVLLVVSAFISYYVLCNIPTPITDSLSKFFWNLMMTLFINTTVTVVLFLLFKCEINTFFRRITAIIKLIF